VKEKIEILSTYVAKATETLQTISTPAAQEKVGDVRSDAIKAIDQVAARNPAAATDGLVKVGTAAVAKGDTASAIQALQSVERLERTPTLTAPQRRQVQIQLGLFRAQLGGQRH